MNALDRAAIVNRAKHGVTFASDVLALDAELERVSMELHGLRWALGLDTHEGEKPQSIKRSQKNLRKMIELDR